MKNTSYCEKCATETEHLNLESIGFRCKTCTLAAEHRIRDFQTIRVLLRKHGLRNEETLTEFILTKIKSGVSLDSISTWADRARYWAGAFLRKQSIKLNLPKGGPRNRRRYSQSQLERMFAMGFSPHGFCTHFHCNKASYYRWKKQIKETSK